MRDRLRTFARFLREHRLVVGFIAAMAPLATLMALQVVWLTDLDRASAMAHRAALRNCIEAVGSEVGYFYQSTAERLLNVPEALFEEGKLAKLAKYWKERPRDGVRRLFAVDYSNSETGNFYTYDAPRKKLIPTEASDESLAIVIAALPFQRWARQAGFGLDGTSLHVTEQDPEHRIILKPVFGNAEKLVGVVGLIVDTDFIRHHLLEKVISKTVPTFFAGSEPAIAVIDGRGRPVLGDTTIKGAHEASHQLPFVLRDWTLRASSHGPVRRWSSGSLVYNLALGFASALALAAGLAVALLGARDAMRLSQMKSDFVSNVSHELRTPLASIRLFAEMMKRGRVTGPDKVIQYGTYIEAESRRLSRLIDNILDFSRIESDQKEYRRERTEVLEVIRPVLDAVSVRLEQSGVKLLRELPEDPGPEAQLDPDAVSQAVYNLLDNAAKYSQGEDEIIVRLTVEDKHAVISVEDHGIGIDKKDQAKVFERFHRVGNTLVHDVKGSGLGLAIVDHTARAHGGRVSLKSEPGEGSTFSLWLPLCEKEVDGEDPDRRG